MRKGLEDEVRTFEILASFLPALREKQFQVNQILKDIKIFDKKVTELISLLRENLSTEDANFQEILLEELRQNVILKGRKEKNLETSIEKFYHGNDYVLEINVGVGGKEAELFAAELFQIYLEIALYFDKKVLHSFKDMRIRLSKDIHPIFLHEIGVHRVQRVPSTEKQGRIHTSTVAVSIVNSMDLEEVDIRNQDLLVETMRSSGAGGQHVNTTSSAVRITHLPTKINSRIGVSRDQHQNRKWALDNIRERLISYAKGVLQSSWSDIKSSQVKNRDRSDKVRTYNFPNDRLTDHRANMTFYNLKELWIKGKKFLEIIDKIRNKIETDG